MFFNYDSMPPLGAVVTTIIIGGLFSYSIYSIFTISSIPTYNEVGIQTESLVNTIQPSIDSISELPETNYPCIQPNVLPDNLHVEVGIQTKSLYTMFKEWLRETFSINSSDLGATPTNVRVENWIGNLDNTQVVSQDEIGSVVSNNQLPNLLNVGESVSNIGIDVPAVDTNDVVDYSYIDLLHHVGETVISEATIQAANEALIQASNAGFFGFGLC